MSEKQSGKEVKNRAGGHRSTLAAPAFISVPLTDISSNQINEFFRKIYPFKVIIGNCR